MTAFTPCLTGTAYSSFFTAQSSYASAVLGIVILSVCLSVPPSVTQVLCDKTKEHTADKRHIVYQCYCMLRRHWHYRIGKQTNWMLAGTIYLERYSDTYVINQLRSKKTDILSMKLCYMDLVESTSNTYFYCVQWNFINHCTLDQACYMTFSGHLCF